MQDFHQPAADDNVYVDEFLEIETDEDDEEFVPETLTLLTNTFKVNINLFFETRHQFATALATFADAAFADFLFLFLLLLLLSIKHTYCGRARSDSRATDRDCRTLSHF